MACPVCRKRKASRFCPPKGERICAPCCGTEREVTIDCPSDCPYLVASRDYDLARRKIDWSKVPFQDIKIPASFVSDHERLLLALSYAMCVFRRENVLVTDSDIQAALEALAESYRTLSSGIYFEKPPVYALQRSLYEKLKAAIEEYRREASQDPLRKPKPARDADVRDALIFLAQLGATRANGRPKGRAYLDFLRTQFKSDEFSRPEARIVAP